MNEDILNTLKTTNVSLIIPLYSYLSDIHDKVTGKTNTFKSTVRNIVKLKTNNIKVIIYLFIHSINSHTVRDTIKFIKDKLGLEYFTDYLISAAPKDAISYLEGNFNFKLRTRAYFNNISLDNISKRKNGNSCWLNRAAVKSNGDVIPCIKARKLIIGNIRNSSLNSLLTNGRFDKYWYLTKDKVRKCRRCEFRYACDDCRLMAITYGGNLLAENPFCTYDAHRGLWGDLSPDQNKLVRGFTKTPN